MQVIRQSASGQAQPPITRYAVFRLQILAVLYFNIGYCIVYDMQILIISGVLRWLEMMARYCDSPHSTGLTAIYCICC